MIRNLYNKFKERFGDKAFEAGLMIGAFFTATHYIKERHKLFRQLGKATFVTISLNKAGKK